MNTFALNLVYNLHYLVLLTLFIVFFTKAIKRPGIEILKTFTIILLYAFFALIALTFVQDLFYVLPIFLRDAFSLLPLRFVKAFHVEYIFYLLLFSLEIYFMVAIILIRKEKTTRHLMAVWIVIACCNLADIAGNTWHFIIWKAPVVDQIVDMGAPLDPVKLILAHTPPRPNYIIKMFYPFCWVIICSISILKISKEKRRCLPTGTVS